MAQSEDFTTQKLSFILFQSSFVRENTMSFIKKVGKQIGDVGKDLERGVKHESKSANKEANKVTVRTSVAPGPSAEDWAS